MSDKGGRLGGHARARGVPSLGDTVAATGGIAIAIGTLLVTIDVRADNSGRAAEVGLFAALVVLGYAAVLFAPVEIRPAGVSAVVLGIPGALGWLILPGAHGFDDVRPFLLLTIVGWLVAFVLPRTRGRTIFVAAAALFLWLWMLGEVAGTGAYSAAPVPSPPAGTVFSLAAFSGARSTVEFTDLDPQNPLYPLARECNDGDPAACDSLYRQSTAGTDFRQFASTCGNTRPNTSAAGFCEFAGTGAFATGPTVPGINSANPLLQGTQDKSFDIGVVSTLFGVAYLGALFVLDRARWRGVATAFVVPGFVALLTGTEALGSAAHHAWVAGALTFAAGIGIGYVGDRTKRRFTCWAGAFAVAYGAMIVAFDSAHITRAFGDGNVKLGGPGLIVMSFGVGLTATGFVITRLLGRSGPPAAPASPGPAAGPPPFETAPTAPDHVWSDPASTPTWPPPPAEK